MGSESTQTGFAEKRVRAQGAGASGSRKAAIDFTKPFFQRTERAAVDLAVNRRSPIRSAIERYLAALRRKRLEEELAAGYAANAELDRRIAAEFSSVDYEDIPMPGEYVRGGMMGHR